MLQGNHALCELGEEKFIFLIKIKRESKGGKMYTVGLALFLKTQRGFVLLDNLVTWVGQVP